MVGYLGGATDSLIKSIFSSLPLVTSATIAYAAGAGFYERVREAEQRGRWHKVRHNRLLSTPTVGAKLRAASEGAIQHRLNKLHLRPAARAPTRHRPSPRVLRCRVLVALFAAACGAATRPVRQATVPGDGPRPSVSG
jgi:hypothetical protein